MPFWQFLRNWLIGWIGHALLVQPSISAHRKWPEMVVSASTNQVWTKITVRSYAWSFGHSDPDPSNVINVSMIFKKINFILKGLNLNSKQNLICNLYKYRKFEPKGSRCICYLHSCPTFFFANQGIYSYQVRS